MKSISQRELRNQSAAIMDAVESGETLTITRRGVEVAELRPVSSGTFVPTAEVVRRLGRFPAGGLEQMRQEADALLGDDSLAF